MTVCANRSDNPGFFTPCKTATTACVCGAQVAAELKAQTDTTEETP